MTEEKRREEKGLPRVLGHLVLATTALGAAAHAQNLPICEEEKLLPVGAQSPNDTRFGEAIDIDGDYMIVGAPKADQLEGTPPLAAQVGLAYIFERDSALQLGSRWIRRQTLQAQAVPPNQSDLFGQSVAITDPRAVVGAPADNFSMLTDAGSVFVWVRTGTLWSEEQRLTAPTPAAGDFFGWAVDIDDSVGRVVIGAIEPDRPGSAYVSERMGTTWGTPVELNPTLAPSSGDSFGNAVSIDGDTIAVGADLDDTDLLANNGTVVIFTKSGSTWQQEQLLKAPALQMDSGDQFGCSVSLDGDYVAIGAPFRDSTASSDEGVVFVFSRSGTNWGHQATLTSPSPAASDLFGTSVSLDGTNLIVGTKNAEAAYLYVRNGTAWDDQEPILSSSNSATGADFGSAVAISGDIVALGALFDDTTDVGGYVDSGAAYAFVEPEVAQQRYCTAKLNSQGDTPEMSTSGGFPSVSVGGTNRFYVKGEKIIVYQSGSGTYTSTGILNYSVNGRINQDFHGGKLCVKAPTRFTPALFEVYQSSYFKTSKGVLSVDFNTMIQSGNNPELAAGELVQAQWMFDDPWDATIHKDGLTDGIEFAICP